MLKKIGFLNLIFSLALSLSFGSSFAQAPAATQLNGNKIAPSTEITNVDFNLPSPGFWQFFWRRAVLLFTFDKVSRLELRADLATLKLLAAQKKTTDENDHQQAAENIVEFNKEFTQVTQEVTQLINQVSDTDQQKRLEAFLEKLQGNRLLQANLTEQLSSRGSGPAGTELLAKAQEARAKALEDLAKLLKADNPSSEKFQARLTKITQKLAKKQAKVEEKIAKKLALLDELDKEIDEDEFEDELEREEEEELEKIGQIDDLVKIGEIVKEIEGSVSKHVLVLESVLEKVPDQAKPAIQEAIDKGTQEIYKQLKSDRDLLEKLLQSDRREKAKKKLLGRLQEEAQKAQEDVEKEVADQIKKQIKEERERVEKELEELEKKAKKELKEAEESLKEAEKKAQKAEKEADERTKKELEELKEKAKEELKKAKDKVKDNVKEAEAQQNNQDDQDDDEEDENQEDANDDED